MDIHLVYLLDQMMVVEKAADLADVLEMSMGQDLA
jgi:hypothetical protein